MNPAAPRDPLLTRVLLSIAGALFLLNLCVLVAGVHARSAQDVTRIEPSGVHRCLDAYVMVPRNVHVVDGLSIDISHLRTRVERLRQHMDEVAPRVRVEIHNSTASETL